MLRRCVWSRNIKNGCFIYIYIYDISRLRVNFTGILSTQRDLPFLSALTALIIAAFCTHSSLQNLVHSPLQHPRYLYSQIQGHILISSILGYTARSSLLGLHPKLFKYFIPLSFKCFPGHFIFSVSRNLHSSMKPNSHVSQLQPVNMRVLVAFQQPDRGEGDTHQGAILRPSMYM